MECWSKWDRMSEFDLQLLGHFLFQSVKKCHQVFLQKCVDGCEWQFTGLRFIQTAKQRRFGILFAENHLGESQMNFRLDIYWLADPPCCRSLALLVPTTHLPASALSDRPRLSHAFPLLLEILLRRPGARLHGNAPFGSPPSSFVLTLPAAHTRACADKHVVGKKNQLICHAWKVKGRSFMDKW